MQFRFEMEEKESTYCLSAGKTAGLHQMRSI